VDGVCFFHKGPLPPAPANVREIEVVKRGGEMGKRLWVDDLAGLLGLLELGVVELHPWNCTVDDLEHVNQLVFDLDPDEETPWPALVEAALRLRDHLRAVGLHPWAKTTGGRGLHLVTPVTGMGWEDANAVSRTAAESFAATAPELYTAVRGPAARRGGKVFIDWLRNGRGQTAIGAMSPRARAGGLVSMPGLLGRRERGAQARPVHPGLRRSTLRATGQASFSLMYFGSR
jgi:bifunctional non-homologous end joining protein LigD